MRFLTRKKKELKIWILLGFVFSYMISLFAPVDFYFANPDEYWFSVWQLLVICGIVFVVVFFLFLLFSMFIVNVKFSRILLTAFFFGTIWLYIQGNWIPRDYGVLNGKGINWDNYTGYAISSIVVAVVCIMTCIIICVKYREQIPKVVKYGSIYLLIIMTGTTIWSFVGNASYLTKENGQVVTTKEEFVLSGDRDIVVFLLDTFDAGYFSNMLKKDWDTYAELFQNFTFYPDCVGAYPTTKGAVPYILTGVWYENKQSFADYYLNAYDNNPVYEAFAQNGYGLDVYTKNNCLSSDASKYYNNIMPGEYRISDSFSFAKAVYKMVAFNYMPHQLKRFFWTDSDSFSSFKKTNMSYSAFSTDVVKYAKRLKKNGVSVEPGKKRFKFYHLTGVHSPYTFGKKLIEDKEMKYTVYDEAEGNFTILSRYFQQMKDNGTYDSSTIIILADHGELNYAQNPLFMVKNAEDRHEFTVSNSKMSWEYLSDLWENLANGVKIDELFFQDYADRNSQRRFLYYQWDDAWKREYLPAMEEMICEGKASNPEDMKPTGVVYLAESADYSYTPGTILEFTSGRTGYSYCLNGIRYGIVSLFAQLRFDLGVKTSGDLLLSIKTMPSCKNGTVDLYINDRFLTQTEYTPSSIIQVRIPDEYRGSDGTVLVGFDQTGGSNDFHNSLIPSSFVIDTIEIVPADITEELQEIR